MKPVGVLLSALGLVLLLPATVAAQADLSVIKEDAPDPVAAGENLAPGATDDPAVGGTGDPTTFTVGGGGGGGGGGFTPEIPTLDTVGLALLSLLLALGGAALLRRRTSS